MADSLRARDALTKSTYTFQDINPKDDMQFRRIASKQGAFKKNITLAIKKAEDLHENIKKLDPPVLLGLKIVFDDWSNPG